MFEWTGDNNQEILKNIREHKQKVRSVVAPVYRDDLDKKKVSELANAGKFLLALDENARIVEMRESPDFVFEMESRRIGLENRVIRYVPEQKMIGSLENFLKAASAEFSRRHPDLKIEASIYLKRVWIPKKEWKDAIAKIVDYTFAAFSGQRIALPDFLNEILILPNSNGPILSYNPGVYMQRDLTEDALLEAIEEKNELCESYRHNTGIDEQWLLLVIGETGPASHEIEDFELKGKIETTFTRVYILEDFNNTVTRII